MEYIQLILTNGVVFDRKITVTNPTSMNCIEILIPYNMPIGDAVKNIKEIAHVIDSNIVKDVKASNFMYSAN